MAPRVSVIVPSWGDEGLLKKNLSILEGDPAVEVIIVRAEEVGRANRACQMNLGASASGGQTLVFLHADTRIYPQDLLRMTGILERNPTLAGGAFRFALDSSSWKARVVEFGVRLREFFFRLPYGDQAIFVRREIFEKIGGYPEAPLLEDVLLIQRMKSEGKLLSFDARAVTSARRWESCGYLRTTLVNWSTMILWKSGVPLEKIRKFRERIFYDPVSGELGVASD